MTPEQRERKRVYNKAWREANPERVQAQNKEWYEANTERSLARNRAWREANRVANLSQRKTYREANSTELRTALETWREANREHTREYAKAYAVANQVKRRQNEQNRRARKMAAFVESVDHDAVFIRDGGVCQICDKFIGAAEWEVDHVIPISRGGPHSYANTQLAHAHCNRVKHAKVPA